ncbi:MAG: PH domain-containing protein [Methanomassiliicoccaceae archaeon]|nr:PH domain-containing protein [Methanomassiliicoccaceae archaeon]
MRTDADGNMIFRTSAGKLYYSLLAVTLLSSLVFLAPAAYRIITGTGGTFVFLLLGSISLLTGVYVILLRSMRYVLEKDGIRLPKAVRILSWGLQDHIPYSSVTRFYENNSFTRVVGLSTDQVWIEFKNVHGKKDGVGLSPEDKQTFISELSRRSGIHVSADPHAKKR